ncbi:calcium-binding protein [Sorangium sp. So ce385]|uniref:calcium-binding protein n=1 Tax=Sorangium sp. So ce385 TaxID=3133308 RepID=UPI003F5B6418
MASVGALGAASACTAEGVPLADILPNGGVDPVTIEATGMDSELNEIDGTSGNDVLNGTAADDILSGLDGNDVIHGLGGHDDLYGDGGDDDLFGDQGNDLLAGGPGNDDLYGGEGNDHLIVNSGNDLLDGGNGSDTYYFDGGQGVIYNMDTNDANVDTLIIRYIAASPSDVVFQRDLGDLVITVPGHPDTLRVLAFFGGNGATGYTIDRIRFGTLSSAPQMTADEVAYLVNYGGGAPVVGTSFTDFLDGSTGQDLISGLDANDYLFGYEGNDGLYGQSGNDTLYGGPGNDELVGGVGNDKLHGGTGGDSYLFAPGDGTDIIYQPSEPDYGSNYDYIRIGGSPALIETASFRMLNDTDLEVRLAPEHGLTITVRDFLDPFTGDIASPNELDDIRWPDHTLCRPTRIRNALVSVPQGTAVNARTACGSDMRW